MAMEGNATPTAGGLSAAATGAARRGRHRFERPRVAVDTVIFAVAECRLKTYLVQLKGGPSRGKWAFPGRPGAGRGDAR